MPTEVISLEPWEWKTFLDLRGYLEANFSEVQGPYPVKGIGGQKTIGVRYSYRSYLDSEAILTIFKEGGLQVAVTSDVASTARRSREALEKIILARVEVEDARKNPA